MTGKKNFLPFPPESIARLQLSGLKYTPLTLAALPLDTAKVAQLLSEGADVHERSSTNTTTLHVVADFGYCYPEKALEIINLLLDAGAEVNVQDKEGVTPLMNASYRRCLPIVSLLIERGADVNIRRNDGNTILGSIWGAPSLRMNSKRLIKLLEEAGGVA